MLMKDNLSRPGPLIGTGVQTKAPLSFANKMNINTVSPEDTRLYPKTEPQNKPQMI